MKPLHRLLLLSALAFPALLNAQELRHVRAAVTGGVIEGVVSADDKVRTFKGIPFAAPPVGDLRWREPQPVVPWTGVRQAVDFGARPMQGFIYSDMVFHDAGPSEDCLYLNLWKPEHAEGKLPVMVWIYGGGYAAGSTSEPRQDAGNLSKKGVIVVSMNYRLGVFGFMVHPELDKETAHGSSGNYGLLDQVAALRWVRANIATFGGDPDNVTIFGESAGSGSVCALVASPLSRGLFTRAIGESGACLAPEFRLVSHAEALAKCASFDAEIGKTSLAELRAMPAQDLLKAQLRHDDDEFQPNIDNYFVTSSVLDIYKAGEQAHVPLIAGWNRDEGGPGQYFESKAPNLANYVAIAKSKFGSQADDFLKVYAAGTDAEAKRAAADFEGDRSIAYGTWKWLELQGKTGGSPVYRYMFDNPLPLAADAAPGAEPTANHSWEIEYVFRTITWKKLPWRPEDHKVSDIMSSYWTNFAKTGNPNGEGLPVWPEYRSADGYQVMDITPTPSAAPDAHRDRYLFLDKNWDGATTNDIR
ncbi:MAG TPA: carboxylesterase family protein [Opitutaceae bacterium]|jgi:para-nitrobenzyl esterase|nr:carboxylesterase family protein [Opitutaceae bacterium]